MISLLVLVACDGGSVTEDVGLTCDPGDICTVAGDGIAGLGREDVPAVESMLYLPQDMAFHPDGTAYLLDWNNHRIRQIRDDGTIITTAGDGMIGDGPEGPALEARFNHPTNIVFDAQGVMTMAAWHNSRIERVDFSTGMLSFIAGDGTRAFGGDDGPANVAKLDLPSSIAYSADGTLYLADQANQRIRRVGADGIITTYAGTGTAGYAGDGGPALEAQIHAEVGQAAAPTNKITIADEILYIADTANHRIRMIDLATGIIDTLAGTGEAGYAGDGGAASAARLWGPTDVAVGPDGEVYFTDTENNCVRVITADGMIDSFAGACGGPGFEGDGGPAIEAALDTPYGIEVAPNGDLWIADTYNQRIRVVSK